MRKALVIGLGKSGKSAVTFLEKKGFSVTGVDDKNPSSASIQVTEFDLVVVSPGIPPSHPLYRAALASGVELIGEAELALRHVEGQKVVGITGTNGKTTVTLMIEHVLNACGIDAIAVGNVGRPITSELGGNRVLVVELSSFQLETIHAKVLDAAVILNISEDHMDRYDSMEEYARAKWRIADCLKPGAVFCDRTNDTFSDFEEENQKAAFSVCKVFGVSELQFKESLSTFQKPPHRLEFVRHLNGVHFYNDSKGTNIDSVISAVQKMEGPVILIAGGQSKGASFIPWKIAIRDKITHLLAIGEASSTMAEELAPDIKVETVETLPKAVARAVQLGQSGDSVLLSPGCASFDQFRNYAHRGDAFKTLVLKLKV